MDNAVILAGGQGKRMKADMPKPMFRVLGEPMLEWVISACEAAEIKEMCIVKGFMGEIIDEYLGGRYKTVMQAERLGTGHAVMQAVPFLKENIDGNTLVLCGDAPFIDSDTITKALEAHKSEGNSVTVITSELDMPKGYGRIIRTENGISGIVEEKDADDTQRQIKEVNSGAYWFRTADLLDFLGKLTRNNVQGEYYLTDTISIAISEGKRAGAYKSANPDVILGANDRKGLLALNNIARRAVIEKHLDNGVAFTCTDGVIIERSVEIETGAEIFAGSVLTGSTKIGKESKIGPNTILNDCTVGEGVELNNVQGNKTSFESGKTYAPWHKWLCNKCE